MGSSTNVANIWHESANRFALVSTDSSSTGYNINILNYNNLQVATLYSDYVESSTGTFDGSLYVSGRVGIGIDTPSFGLEIQETGLRNYVPSGDVRIYPSGILNFLNNQNINGGHALIGFKDRPTSSIWYAGNAGSQDEGLGAKNYTGPFVVGNRTGDNGYSEKT